MTGFLWFFDFPRYEWLLGDEREPELIFAPYVLAGVFFWIFSSVLFNSICFLGVFWLFCMIRVNSLQQREFWGDELSSRLGGTVLYSLHASNCSFECERRLHNCICMYEDNNRLYILIKICSTTLYCCNTSCLPRVIHYKDSRFWKCLTAVIETPVVPVIHLPADVTNIKTTKKIDMSEFCKIQLSTIIFLD